MAHSSNKRNPQGKPAGSGANRSGDSKGAGPSAKPIARQSVAAARKSASGSNRTQLIIGGVAIAVIIAVIVLGLVLNRRETAVQAPGYGASTQSVATESNGVVTVAKPGTTPAVSIDIYADALCPICGEFERQFGQQINEAVDNGSLAVNYHMLDFLSPKSPSGDYSTRAAAALTCVAQHGGSQPGLYLGYLSALFSADHQPAESGSADLTNDQLAQLATTSGAPPAAADCISAGANVAAAAAAAATSMATLSQVTGGQVATPTVVHDGAPVQLAVDWLAKLLGQS